MKNLIFVLLLVGSSSYADGLVSLTSGGSYTANDGTRVTCGGNTNITRSCYCIGGEYSATLNKIIPGSTTVELQRYSGSSGINPCLDAVKNRADCQ